MNDNQLWLGLLIVLMIGIALITGLTQNYYKDKHARIAEMISAGMNPIQVMCVLEDTYGNNPTCVLLAHNEGGK